jgi:hypothetical protein
MIFQSLDIINIQSMNNTNITTDFRLDGQKKDSKMQNVEVLTAILSDVFNKYIKNIYLIYTLTPHEKIDFEIDISTTNVFNEVFNYAYEAQESEPTKEVKKLMELTVNELVEYEKIRTVASFLIGGLELLKRLDNTLTYSKFGFYMTDILAPLSHAENFFQKWCLENPTKVGKFVKLN